MSLSRRSDRRPSVFHRRRLFLERMEERAVFAVGDLDVTFGGDGVVQTELLQGGQESAPIMDLAVESDGKLIAVGNRFLTRMNAGGTLDGTSGFEGKVVLPQPLYSAEKVLIQPNGKILVGSQYGVAIARYNTDLTLDTSFDQDGVLSVPSNSSSLYLKSMALQSDGKIVAVGYISTYNDINGTSDNDFLVLRFNENGSLDENFDGDGIVTTDLGSTDDQAYDVVIQADGKIVIVGQTSPTNDLNIAVVRYNTDGSLDTDADADPNTSFDVDGIRFVTSGGIFTYDIARAVALDADQNIVVAGVANNRGALIRLLPNGNPDPTFDDDGLLETQISYIDLSDVVIQSDDKIVVTTRLNNNFAALRYNSDGRPDMSYGTDGVVEVNIANYNSVNAAVLVPGDPLIPGDQSLFLAGGAGPVSYSLDFAVARLTSSGALDTSFNDDGKVIFEVGTSADISKYVAVQSDQKIVTVGTTFTPANSSQQGTVALTRHLSNGELDKTFSDDGAAFLNVSLYDENIIGLAILPDGKILVGGSGYFGPTLGYQFYLVRFLADGTSDVSFGGDGIVTTDFDFFAEANAMTVQSDGKVILVGQGGNDSGDLAAVVRFNADGTLDETFDGDGLGLYDIMEGPYGTRLNSVAVQADGKLVLAGYDLNSSNNRDFLVARLNETGGLDNSFGGTGTVRTGFVTGRQEFGQDVVVQPDGKILVAGFLETDESLNGTGSEMAVARYNSDGTLDTLFNFTGKVLIDFNSTPFGQTNELAAAVYLTSDGKIALTGQSRGNDNYGVAVARLNFDGSLDRSFSGDGKAVYVTAGISSLTGSDITAQADGSLIVTGNSDYGGDFVVARIIGSEPNQVPAVASRNFNTDEDVAFGMSLTGTDPDNDALEYTLVSLPAHGVLSGSGEFLVYTPQSNYVGPDQFIFKVDDGRGGVTAATVTITVNSVNDRPFNTLQSLTAETVDQNGTLVFSDEQGNRLGLVDIDAGNAAVQLTLAVSHGTLTLPTTAGLSFNFAPDANGSPAGDGTNDPVLRFRGTLADINAALDGLTYTPYLDFSGPDVFSLRANDLGNTGAGGAKTDLDSININVIDGGGEAPNQPPSFVRGPSDVVQEDAGLQTFVGWASNISPGPANDAGQTVDFQTSNNNPSLFEIPPSVSANGTLTYKPAANANGEAVVTVIAHDNGGSDNGGVDTSAPQVFTIKVFPVNDRPITVPNVYSLAEDQVLTTTLANGLLSNDIDVEDGDALNAMLVTKPRYGKVSLNEDGTFVYTPTANYAGVDTFKYRAIDPNGANAVGIAIITVQSANDAPTADPLFVSLDEGTFIDLILSAADPEGDALGFGVVTPPAHGQLTGDPANPRYTPVPGFHGTDSFTFRVNDGQTDSAAATVTIDVRSVNEAPTGTADAYTLATDTVLTVLDAGDGVLDNDSDPDNDPLAALLVRAPSHGVLSLQPDGSFSYLPARAYAGLDSFTYRAFDGTDYSPPITVTIQVKSITADVPEVWLPRGVSPVNVVTVRVTNTTQTTWNANGANAVHLGYYFNGVSDALGGWASEPGRVSLPRDVAPGETATFTVALNGPDAPGDYTLRMRLVKEGVAWFTELVSQPIHVEKQASSFTVFPGDIPTVWAPGERKQAIVYVTNTAGPAWNSTGPAPVHLGYYWDATSDLPGGWTSEPNRYSFAPFNILAGERWGVGFETTAPTTPGIHTLYVRMVKESYGWFDEFFKIDILVQ